MNKTRRRLLSGVLIGGLLLASGGAVMAATNNSPNFLTGKPLMGQKMPGGKNAETMLKAYQEVLDKLVSQATITKAQADKLLALHQEKEKQEKTKLEKNEKMSAEQRKALRDEKRGPKVNLLDEAVTKGIINQDEAKAIRLALVEKANQQRQAEVKEKLNQLVTQGTLTNAQVDAILAKMESQAKERQADMEKIKQMTAEERQQYLQNKKTKLDLLDTLIKEGTINKAQAYDVAKILRAKSFGPRMGHPGMRFPGCR